MAGLDLMTLRIFAAAALAATTSLHAAPALAQGRDDAGIVGIVGKGFPTDAEQRPG